MTYLMDVVYVVLTAAKTSFKSDSDSANKNGVLGYAFASYTFSKSMTLMATSTPASRSQLQAFFQSAVYRSRRQLSNRVTNEEKKFHPL